VTLGIGNILMAFAEIADRRSYVTIHVLTLAWLLLLLGREWTFAGFFSS